ncbi:MAG: 23S rRNA (adenine(2503)-C(2))-methyltransferase RlmN [Acidimicrobiia bacterium]
MTSRYAASRDDYTRWFAARGQPKFRTEQVWSALYPHGRPLESLTTVPERLRAELAADFPAVLSPVLVQQGDRGTTRKWLLRTVDGYEIETVLMLSPERATVCVSSQAGCAMGCTFCATGQAGFDRHLSAAEIVEQVAHAARDAGRRISNVVFMGMGEPLANFDATWGAVERLHHEFGISARRITVSTVGIVPGMQRLAAEELPVTLAVSLHAPNDQLRQTMVPINQRYPLREVMRAAASAARAHGRRVTFEYACIEGVNDAPEHAEQLAELLAPLGPLGSHVNLIPLNRTAGFAGSASTPEHLREFAARLSDAGLSPTIRRNRGTDIDAACGQLRERATEATDAPSARMTP